MFTWLHDQWLLLWDRHWPVLIPLMVSLLAWKFASDYREMRRRDAADEEKLLAALQQDCPRGGEWYGVPLSDETGIPYFRMYEALRRLEERGLVETWAGDPTPARGMRNKRFCRLKPQ